MFYVLGLFLLVAGVLFLVFGARLYGQPKVGEQVSVWRTLIPVLEEPAERFYRKIYQVQNTQKTDFDYVVWDSDVECQFAELLDGREDIKLFMKLPAKFKIDTPVGPYNPDWAIIKQEDGEDRIYMIRETKSTLDDSKLRPTELAKIKSAKRHFKTIGVEDYARAVPGAWKI